MFIEGWLWFSISIGPLSFIVDLKFATDVRGGCWRIHGITSFLSAVRLLSALKAANRKVLADSSMSKVARKVVDLVGFSHGGESSH